MDSIEGYCLKCKEKRVMSNPQAEWAANGSPATRGVCPVCGTNIYLCLGISAHDTLPKPVATAPAHMQLLEENSHQEGVQ